MKRILFVDDEDMLLQGLRRMIYRMRDQWEAEYSNCTDDALNRLANSRFDVIISDMRMPDMDGASLLREVSRLYPSMIRIILTGQADEDAIMRCAGVAHLILTKPCDADVLNAALSRACGLTDLLEQSELKDVVSKMKLLPSIPQTYTELVRELKSDDPSIRKVAEIISRDVSMVARILHLANSAYFIGRFTVTNPTDAILRLGLRSIEGLVLYAHIFSLFDDKIAKSFNIDSIMTHSIQVGNYTRVLARHESLSERQISDAFTAGIMHDVGKLMFAANLPQEYKQVVDITNNDGMSDWEAEQQIFKTNHAVVGAYLMRLWGISDAITETIAFHHSPCDARHTEMDSLALVHIANGIEHDLRSNDENETIQGINASYIETLGRSEKLPVWRQICKESSFGR